MTNNTDQKPIVLILGTLAEHRMWMSGRFHLERSGLRHAVPSKLGPPEKTSTHYQMQERPNVPVNGCKHRAYTILADALRPGSLPSLQAGAVRLRWRSNPSAPRCRRPGACTHYVTKNWPRFLARRCSLRRHYKEGQARKTTIAASPNKTVAGAGAHMHGKVLSSDAGTHHRLREEGVFHQPLRHLPNQVGAGSHHQ